jgi:TolA-binding protein
VVELYQGSVVVAGPQVPAGVPLSAGHRLVGTARSDGLLVSDLAPAQGAAAQPSAAPSVAATAVEAADAGARESSTPTPGDEASEPHSWREQVAAGEFAAVVSEAEAAGIDAVLEQRSLEDLIALGDAARYAKRSDLASKILLAERKRFPASPQATTAAFLLGRIAEGRSAAGEALQWYLRYRLEAPNGSLAEEALGRIMLIQKQSGEREGARAAAELYLASYPGGGFARAAKEIVGEP